MRNLASSFVLVAVVGCGGTSSDTGAQDSSSSGPSSTDPTTSSSTAPTTTVSTDDTSTAGPTTTVDTSESGTGDTSSSSGETGEVVLHGACPLDNRVGGFVLLREESYTTFSGSVSDGVVPASVLENIGEDGDCVLLRRNNPFCDPTCGPGTTCDFDGNCIDYPANHDVGTVDVTGLLQAVSVMPLMPTYDYFDTDLPHPAWDPLSQIQLSAAGGDYEAFELAGVGVEMIVPDPTPLELDPMAPLDVVWTAEDGPQQVRIELTIDLHGATPSKLVCTVPDTGMTTIPQGLIEQFVGLGVTGFPNVTYYRETVDSIEIEPGCVELGVRSYDQQPLTVVGHTPCTSDDECPDGQTCDIPNETCIDG